MTSYNEQRQSLLERKQKAEAMIAQLREDIQSAIKKANEEIKSITDNLYRLDAEHAALEKQRIEEILERLATEERAMQARIDAERSRLAAEEMDFQQKIDSERSRLAVEQLEKQQSGVSTLLHLIFSLFFRAPIGIRGAYRLG
jgi:chromosome segregation ATPase